MRDPPVSPLGPRARSPPIRGVVDFTGEGKGICGSMGGIYDMPHCRNCDAFVTENYVRVFAPQALSSVRVCPNCEDKLRDGAEVREARSTRQN